MPRDQKPTRAALMRAFQRIQDQIGRAMAAVDNDRDPERMRKIHQAHEAALTECYEATKFDPYPRSKKQS